MLDYFLLGYKILAQWMQKINILKLPLLSMYVESLKHFQEV